MRSVVLRFLLIEEKSLFFAQEMLLQFVFVGNYCLELLGFLLSVEFYHLASASP